MPWKIAGECHKRVALITLLICKSLLPGLEDRLLLYCALRPILFSFRVSQTKVTCIYDVWKCFEMKMLIGYGKRRVETKNKVRNDPLTYKAIRLLYMRRDLPEKKYILIKRISWNETLIKIL